MAISLMTDKKYSTYVQTFTRNYTVLLKTNESKPDVISPDQSAIPKVTVREVEVVIKKMEENKAPGTDEITRVKELKRIN